jgi:hypothetical protein
MPAFAPRSSILANRTRGQDARDAHYGDRVTIGARSYTAELFRDGVKLEQHADGSGFAHVQRLTVKIRKSLLTTAPARGTILTAFDLSFSIESIAGQNITDPAWVIESTRLAPAG